MQNPDQNVADLAEAGDPALWVKLCYEYERSRWESKKARKHVEYRAPVTYDGTSSPDLDGALKAVSRRKSQWQMLLDWCDKRRIEPHEFICMSFDHTLIDRKLAPEPSELRSEKYLLTWRKYRPRLLESMETKLGMEKRAGSAAIASYQVVGTKRDDSYAIVLMNRHVAMSPLMRYCLARSIGGVRFRRIATRFEPEAILQFMRYRRQYKKAWKDVLPKGFAARARRIYPHLIKRLWQEN